MGVLSCEKPGKYHIQQYPISNEQIVNYMLLVAMKVGGNSYYTLPDLTNIGVLFPFEYRVNKEQLITDDHFVIRIKKTIIKDLRVDVFKSEGLFIKSYE